MSRFPEPRTLGKISGVETQGLCVLFGALRSGTTMLRLMINGHPRLICPGETDFLTDFLTSAPDGGWRYDLEAMAQDRIFQNSRANLPTTAEVGPAFGSMVADIKGGEPGRLVLVLHRGLERLLDIVPNIPILHLVRDPRDVARSAIGMGWVGHVYFGTKVWLRSEEEWERTAPRLVSGQSLELRYEALVQRPETVLRNVCSFVGEQYHSRMLSYSESSTYARPDPALCQQWRMKLNARELGLAEPLFGDLLVRRGYELSGHPPIVPSRIERLSLWVRNKQSVWRFRIKRFGLRDPLIMALARRLGLSQFAAPAVRRMNDVTRKKLK